MLMRNIVNKMSNLSNMGKVLHHLITTMLQRVRGWVMRDDCLLVSDLKGLKCGWLFHLMLPDFGISGESLNNFSIIFTA